MSDTPAPTKAATLDDILAELSAIRLLLATRPAAPAPAAAPAQAPRSSSAPASGGGKFDDEPIPQPAQIIDDPGNIQIHFGKNNGVPLSELGDRSLSWYATDQPARLDRNGRPFPPRPQEILLKNAARTLWHTKRGTLTGGTPTQTQAAQPPARSTPAGTNPVPATESADEDVPF